MHIPSYTFASPPRSPGSLRIAFGAGEDLDNDSTISIIASINYSTIILVL